MASIAPHAFFGERVVPAAEAQLAVSSSSVLYGMNVYTVLFVHADGDALHCFRADDHFRRLRQSAAIIGMREAPAQFPLSRLHAALAATVRANAPARDQFARVSIHATSDLPGVRTAGLTLTLSIFLYDAAPILPADGATLKTSLFRRTHDDAIPARAKVGGAYVNSCLAKQDALDAGCDDALFLNHDGFVSELTAANIFLVKDGALITPDPSSDILEGITRRTIIALARERGIHVTERKVALTEIYTADEVFACGTSAFVAPITAVDHRPIGDGTAGALTRTLRAALRTAQTTAGTPLVTTITTDAQRT